MKENMTSYEAYKYCRDVKDTKEIIILYSTL